MAVPDQPGTYSFRSATAADASNVTGLVEAAYGHYVERRLNKSWNRRSGSSVAQRCPRKEPTWQSAGPTATPLTRPTWTN